MEIRALSREIIFLSVPAISEMFLYMLLWVVDTAMIGNYGGQVAVSAVSLSAELVYTFTTIFIEAGIAVGVTSLVARSYGAKRFRDVSGYIVHGLLITGVLSVFIAASLFFFASRLLLLFGAEKEVLMLGTVYLRIAVIGSFFVMHSFVLSGGLRGTGDTRTPLKVALIVNITNIALDYLLIFGHCGLPELGVKGAALATATAQIGGFSLLLFHYITRSEISITKTEFSEISLSRIKEIVRLSVPASLQEAAFGTSRLVTLFFIMQMGTLAFAVNQITITIESISFMPGYGFAIAATALVGQNIGAQNPKKAEAYAWLSLVFGVAVMSVIGIIFLLIPHVLFGLFIKDEAAITLGKACVRIAALEQPFIAASMVLGGALKGAGDTKSPFWVSLVSSWAVRIPLVCIVVLVFNLGIAYVWFVFVIQFFVETVLLIVIFKKGSWKNRIPLPEV